MVNTNLRATFSIYTGLACCRIDVWWRT